jgi:hypothetical protein
MANELTAMIGVFLEIGTGLDMTGSIVPIKHGKLDVHQNEIGPLGQRLYHARLTVSGLDAPIALPW